MWVSRLFTLLLFVVSAAACGGKSIQTTGGEAGAPSECGPGLVPCDETCSDLRTDESNCGACNVRCARDERCIDARCVAPSLCEPGTTQCGNECVDLRYSNRHCGACGVSCGGGSVCQNGICTSPCPSGQCGGVCVDFGSDPNNCGGCGFVCGPGNYCNAGTCFSMCNGTYCNGVCVDLNSDSFNCGGCDIRCPEPAFTCVGGTCQPFCPPELLYCSGTCVDWRFDPSNCGDCGAQCPDGAECVNGTCMGTCPTGTYCEGVCVDTSNDPNNCGGCNNRCMSGFCAGATCATGMCGDRVRQSSEEGDPPPGASMVVPLDPLTCRYDFSRINQWYCHGSCGNWGGGDDCGQEDADAFCKLKMDNPRSTAVSFAIGQARAEAGVCCPPPTYAPGALGCTDLGVLSSRGVSLNISVHPNNLFSTHQAGRVVTNLICTDP